MAEVVEFPIILPESYPVEIPTVKEVTVFDDFSFALAREVREMRETLSVLVLRCDIEHFGRDMKNQVRRLSNR